MLPATTAPSLQTHTTSAVNKSGWRSAVPALTLTAAVTTHEETCAEAAEDPKVAVAAVVRAGAVTLKMAVDEVVTLPVEEAEA